MEMLPITYNRRLPSLFFPKIVTVAARLPSPTLQKSESTVRIEVVLLEPEGMIMAGSSGFLYPHSRYYGQGTPQNIVFNANLQEFAQRVSYISCLASGGKLSPEQAYKDIETLWEQLESSKQQLGVGKS